MWKLLSTTITMQPNCGLSQLETSKSQDMRNMCLLTKSTYGDYSYIVISSFYNLFLARQGERDNDSTSKQTKINGSEWLWQHKQESSKKKRPNIKEIEEKTNSSVIAIRYEWKCRWIVTHLCWINLVQCESSKSERAKRG